MPPPCPTCQRPRRTFELRSIEHSALFLSLPESFLEQMEKGDDSGEEPSAEPFYLDAHACSGCGDVILSVVDLRVLLAHGAADHPESPIRCRACTLPCRGPWQVEAEGVPDPPLAFLAYKVGAPLEAHLCVTCGRVLLALDARDLEGRRALAKHFPDVGGCDRCGRGRLRLTHVDVPYAGRVVLSGPGPSELAAAVCDGCGEASLRVAAARDGL